MTARHIPHNQASVAEDSTELILDGTKIQWHIDRVEAWERGERIAPITIDMALTRACQYNCGFCYAMLQENDRQLITPDVMTRFLDDSARMGVRSISLVGDGESTLSNAFEHSIVYGDELGISMAVGTNAQVINREKAEKILKHLTYLRVNFSAGERDRYAQIMGVKPEWYDEVCQNIRDMVAIKERDGLDVTIGIQMVLMPQDGDQILPFARLGKELGVDYAVVKHCSDDEYGTLGVDYSGYSALHDDLTEAESLSTDDYKVVIKWSKIKEEGTRSYQRCYGPPFMVQVSGSGLVAPCAMTMNDRYSKFHIGNICEESWWDIWNGDRYWEVMGYLSSDDFNAQKMCGTLCLQHKVNESLDQHIKGTKKLQAATGAKPMHINFV
jgi:MoaA/NifB/PqqE/SkfB family radical SAM enzyme